MTILPKKQKKKLIFNLMSKIIDVVPAIFEFLVVSIIGTYLGWSPKIILATITAIVGNNIFSINIIRDSKKTN